MSDEENVSVETGSTNALPIGEVDESGITKDGDGKIIDWLVKNVNSQEMCPFHHDAEKCSYGVSMSKIPNRDFIPDCEYSRCPCKNENSDADLGLEHGDLDEESCVDATDECGCGCGMVNSPYEKALVAIRGAFMDKTVSLAEKKNMVEQFSITLGNWENELDCLAKAAISGAESGSGASDGA